jgi:hypothetical protein
MHMKTVAWHFATDSRLQIYRARVKTFRADIDAAKRQITKVKSFGRPTSARDELFSKGEEVLSQSCSLAAVIRV